MADVFVSYSRKDKDFALRLTQALLDRKREAWVDWEGIAPTAEWLKAIFAAIEGAAAFVFVCSPDSLASEICALELGHAVTNKKRVIPIVCRDIDAAQAPAAVASLNWIFMRDGDDPAAAMDALIVAIDSDFEWLAFHSRVLVRAVEWDRERHERSRLLRGADLKAAEAWVALAGEGTRPDATELQRHYLRTSRNDATRRRRWLVGGSTALLLTAAVSGVVALFNARQAGVEEAAALARKLAADSERVRTERPDLQARALWLAAEAMQRAPSPSLEADQALRSLLAVMPRHLAAVPTGGARTGSLDNRRYGGEFAIAPDGRTVAWTLDSGETRLWTVGADAAAVRSWAGTVRPSWIAFDATGQLLATLIDRKTVRVRDIQSGGLRQEVSLPGTQVEAAAVAARGEHLALLGTDGQLRLFDADGKAEGQFAVDLYHAGEPHVLLRFSGDNRHLAVASVHGLRLCKLDALQACDQMAVEALSDKTALEFSADGRWLAVDMKGKVQVFGTDDTQAAVFETPQSGGLALLRFSPDGRWLAIGASSQSEVKVWDFQANRQMLSLSPGGAATALAVASDSSRVAASGDDGVTRAWSVPGGELQALVSHPGPLAFVADGDRLVTAGDGDTLHLWESTAQGETVRLATSDSAAFRFSEGAPTSVAAAVMAASGSSGFSRWVEGAGNVERAMRQGLRSIVLSSDGRRAWAGHGDFVTAWDLQSLQPLASAEHHPTLDWTTLLPTLKQVRCSSRDTPCQERVDRLVGEGSVVVEAVSPHGDFAATGRADGVARIWRAGTVEPLLSLPGAIVLALTNEHALVSFPALDRWGKPDPRAAQQLRIYSLGDGSQQAEINVDDGLWRAEFDPDGHRLLLVTGDYSIRVLEMPSARELWKRPGGGTPNLSAFSGDARLLAFTESIKSEGQVVVVESGTGNPVGKAVTWSAGAAALAVSHDGRTVAVAGSGGQLGAYDVASGREMARISHADRVVDLAFSHDQQMLATASNDGTARIVDLRMAREIARIRPSGPPGQVRFSPGDRYLATAGTNAMQLWTWRTEDQVAEACLRLPQVLPPDEWRLYLAGLQPQACRPVARR